jgi:hypothetical protein
MTIAFFGILFMSFTSTFNPLEPQCASSPGSNKGKCWTLPGGQGQFCSKHDMVHDCAGEIDVEVPEPID